MPFEEAEAVCRVLKLLDGYMSVMKPQYALHAWNGGCMTIAELREHARAAIELLPSTRRTEP
jgi:hypothetical protein